MENFSVFQDILNKPINYGLYYTNNTFQSLIRSNFYSIRLAVSITGYIIFVLLSCAFCYFLIVTYLVNICQNVEQGQCQASADFGACVKAWNQNQSMTRCRDSGATSTRLWRVLVTFQQRFVCVCVRAVVEFWQLSDALKVCQFPSHIWPNAQELLLGAWPLQPAYKTKFDDVQQL